MIKEILSKSNVSNNPLGNTGFEELDQILNKLNAGELILVGGRPAMGKTSLALDIVKNICSNSEKACLYFSLEMNQNEIAKRMLIKEAKIPYNALKGDITTKNHRLVSTMISLSRYKLFIDESLFTIEKIINESKKIRQENEISLIVIDYIQLVKTTEDQYYSKNIRLIFEELKQLAIELNCAIIILSQLNRSQENTKSKKPTQTSITEYDTIDNLVSKIIFIFREELYNLKAENKNIAELIIVKNSNRDLGTIQLRWNPELLSFEENL